MYLTESKDAHSLQYRILLGYAALIWLFHGLLRIDRWYRQPSTTRKVVWDEELVLVTGGASGLGYSIVSLLATKQTHIAILDVVEPSRDLMALRADIKFYQCDVSDAAAIAKAHEQMKVDFQRSPTIVVSNAGVMRAKPILELTPSEIDTTFAVNTKSHFLLAKEFIPAGSLHFITIASSLASVGAHSLSTYCASKAATVSFHESLTAEVPITTTLICPGQLNTRMFSSLATPNAFFAPVVESLEVAKLVVQKVERREAGEFACPLYARYIPLMRALPSGVQRLLRKLAGLDDAARSLK